MKQESSTGIDSKIFITEIVPMVDKLVEFKCITSTKHKVFYIDSNIKQTRLFIFYETLDIGRRIFNVIIFDILRFP